jgi:hypothetical protein
MARRLNVLAISALALCAPEFLALAGDTESPPPERKEFHLTIEYPYIFTTATYLKVQGPAAMRYGEPAADYLDRNAPPLPASAKGVDPTAHKQEKSAAQGDASPTPAPQANASQNNQTGETIITAAPPAFPVPQNAPTPIPKGAADFSKTPDEVEGYFRNQYNFVPDSHRFFDPIFEPAVAPESAQMGPKSSATYIQTP